jgi:DNA-binding MarR family transcriptional regulator
MPPPETGDDIVDLLLSAGHRLRLAVNDALRAEVGLTLPRLRVLDQLDTRGPRRASDLADAAAVARRTMTETVDGLVADGLVARVAHPTDRRAALLTLTAAGHDRLAAAHRIRTATVTTFTSHLTATDRAELSRLLRSIRAAAGSGSSGGRTAAAAAAAVGTVPTAPAAVAVGRNTEDLGTGGTGRTATRSDGGDRSHPDVG